MLLGERSWHATAPQKLPCARRQHRRPAKGSRFSSQCRWRRLRSHAGTSMHVLPAQDVDVECLLHTPLSQLMAEAASLRDQGHTFISFSPKVFIPLTRLCRDSCGYCTFAQPPKPGRRAYMTLNEVLAVCKLGAEQGCKEALFTLGDKPELLYPEAAAELEAMGYRSTLDYVAAAAAAAMQETGLLPHINAGVMSQQGIVRLKAVSASQGLMLESTSPALTSPGGPHWNCPDKEPHARLATIKAAGRARVPFTSGILIGIGETREHRLNALIQLHELHQQYGHIQEVIIQNFRAKPHTAMQHHPEPSLGDLLWTVAVARIIFGPHMNIQAPPNLTPGISSSSSSSGGADESWVALLNAGINDWGGISPITNDYVNPEKKWPHLNPLAAATAAAGKLLLPRLPVYPEYILDLSHAGGSSSNSSGAVEPWLSRVGGACSVAAAVMRASDSTGLVRGSTWVAGMNADQAGSISGSSSSSSVGLSTEDGEYHGTQQQPEDFASQQQQRQDQQQQVPDQQALLEQMQQPAQVVRQQLQQLHHQQQQQQVVPAIPLPRRRAHKLWDITLNQWGVLEGLTQPTQVSPRIQHLLDAVLQTSAATAGVSSSKGTSVRWQQQDVELLLSARGADMQAVVAAADALRQRVCGDDVSYVVNRNINYTNVCTYSCKFCAFSKGKSSESLRGAPYLLPLAEISRRSVEAWQRGATEVCLQGGIHPDFTGQTYLDILAAVKAGAPDIHVHAFSPLEVLHGATTLGLSLHEFLSQLKQAGLGSLPGTAAEVLDTQVRAVLCPDKLSSEQWLEVVSAAHDVALKTTSTIMFGHVDSLAAWARHLLQLKDLQARTGGITEFVPLPFVHMESPLYLAGGARKGPTVRECTLMHAVARLVLHPHITNIQASWVKMGPACAAQLLAAGCNDMGGSIMNESITKAAGASYGQELPPSQMNKLIEAAGRKPYQRTTLYSKSPDQQVERSFSAAELAPVYMGESLKAVRVKGPAAVA